MITLKVPRLLLVILLLKILGTIFAVFLFAKFSSLGDSSAYLNGKHTANSILSSRTALLGHLTVFLKSIFVFDLLVHLFFSILSGIGLWFAVSSFPIISLKSRRLILLVFLSPSFLIWSGIVSKEAFVLFPLGLMVYCYFNILQHEKILMNCLLCSFGFVLVLFIRPNFFPVYFLIFFSTFFVLKAWFKYFSYGVLLVFVFFIALSSYYFIVQSFGYEIDAAVSWSKIMFLSYDSDTNRYWVQWDSLSDYFLNMYC